MTLDITAAIEKRNDEIARLRALTREIKALAREANRARPRMSDAELMRRAQAAAVEAKALGLSFDARDVARVEVV